MQTRRYDVYGVGHALVDTQHATAPAFLEQMGIDKGVMTLVNEARQIELSRALLQEPIASSSGGSAANTMIGVAAFGGSAYYACQVGSDPWGEFYLRDLAAAGVDTRRGCRVSGTTGQCMVFITPDADRTLNTCLGVGSSIGPESVEPEVVAESSYVYLEGYLVGTNNGMATCLRAQQVAHEHEVAVALTLSDPFVVANARDRFVELVEAGVDVLFCNEDEARAYAQCENRNEACRRLSEQVATVCVTCGAEGALLSGCGRRYNVPGVCVDAVDTTGAGDLFAGGVLFGLAHGYSLQDSGRLGAYAAAQVVARYGARLGRSLAEEINTILGAV
jgi:sugar/nucleoside kinase (ribokinase family)